MGLNTGGIDEERKRAQETHGAWGDKLPPAQFIAREERLRAHAWPRAALTAWFLRDDDGALLASCETYRMHSFLDGERSDSFGIASVFTESALRRRGHATRLIDLLLARVRKDWPPAHAMLLFS